MQSTTLLNLLLKKKKKFPWPIQYNLSRLAAVGIDEKLTRTFEAIETFCLFIGYSRSGHSLVAALLDANPNIVMAHELRAIKYADAGLSRNALYYLLLKNTSIRGHSWRRGNGYTYDVPNQWQGAYQHIQVIGDKHGEFSATSIASRPELLRRLYDLVEIPIKLVHVVRNPFDNIATMALKKARNSSSPSDLRDTVSRYFKVCESIMDIKAMASDLDYLEIYDLRHEDIIEQTQPQLRDLCFWLNVLPSDDYLDACASIVFELPSKSRHKVEWGLELKQEVEEKISLFPFLKGYSFLS
ncbi:MAG: sulfotransferase [Elainellaceae cyanobacterium]